MLARRACFSAAADPDTRARQGVQSRLTPLPRSSSPFSRSSWISVGLISRNLSRAHGNRKDVARRARYRVRNRPGVYVPFLLPFCCPSLLVFFSRTLRVLEMKGRNFLRPSSLLWQRELTGLSFPFLHPPLPSPFEPNPLNLPFLPTHSEPLQPMFRPKLRPLLQPLQRPRHKGLQRGRRQAGIIRPPRAERAEEVVGEGEGEGKRCEEKRGGGVDIWEVLFFFAGERLVRRPQLEGRGRCARMGFSLVPTLPATTEASPRWDRAESPE